MKPMNLLIIWISINLMSGVLNDLGVPPGIGHVVSTDPEQVYNAFEPGDMITGWTGDSKDYTIGDPVRAGRNLWTTISLYVNGVPAVLSSWGVPEPIVLFLNAIWIIIWAVFAWEFVSGRILVG
jgi:hypothetical protein